MVIGSVVSSQIEVLVWSVFVVVSMVLAYIAFVVTVSMALFRMKTYNPREYQSFAGFWYWYIHPIGIFYMAFYVLLGWYKKENSESRILLYLTIARICLLVFVALLVMLMWYPSA